MSSRVVRLFQNVVTSLFLRFGNVVIMMAMIPLALQGLGTDSYSVFATLISLSLAFVYADFGLGNSVINSVGRDDSGTVMSTVSTVTFLLVMIAFSLVLLSCILYGFSMVSSGIFAAMILMAANIPVSIVHKILLADGRKYYSDLANLLGKILGLVLVFVCNKMKLGVEWYFLSVFGSIFITNVAVYFYFVFKSSKYKFSRKLVDLSESVPLLKVGLGFLVIQLAYYLAYGGDLLFLKGEFLDEFVSAYDICVRMFAYVPALISIAVIPLWPTFNEAIKSGDFLWVRKVYLFIIGLVVFLCVGSSWMVFYYFSDFQDLWVGQSFDEPSEHLRIMIGATMVLISIGSVQSIFMNSAGLISYQAKTSLVFIFLIVTCKYYFSVTEDISSFVFSGMVCVFFRFLAQSYGAWLASKKLTCNPCLN